MAVLPTHIQAYPRAAKFLGGRLYRLVFLLVPLVLFYYFFFQSPWPSTGVGPVAKPYAKEPLGNVDTSSASPEEKPSLVEAVRPLGVPDTTNEAYLNELKAAASFGGQDSPNHEAALEASPNSISVTPKPPVTKGESLDASKSPFEPATDAKSPFSPDGVAGKASETSKESSNAPDEDEAGVALEEVYKAADSTPKETMPKEEFVGKHDSHESGPVTESSSPSSSTSSLWDGIEFIFGFGDSWTTSSFDVTGPQPSRSNPFGNPPVPKNGTTYPPEWLHYLTTTYNHTFIRTYNIAKGAATIDRAIVPPHPGFAFTQTLAEQALTFKNLYSAAPPVSPWEAANTLFAVWFGVVDIALLLERDEYATDINVRNAASYQASLDELYRFGARRFLLVNVPPMYLMPNAEHTDVSREAVPDFNARLLDVQKEFLAQHEDAQVFLLDVNGLLEAIIKDPKVTPQTAGIRNTTENCWDYNPDAFSPTISWDRFDPRCGIPFDQYFWANPLHPTHPVHEAIAATVVKDCLGAKRGGYCT